MVGNAFNVFFYCIGNITHLTFDTVTLGRCVQVVMLSAVLFCSFL